jgi:hypothetical protein
LNRGLGQRKAVAGIRQRVVGVAAVDLVAGEAGFVAQVLAAAGAVAAVAAGPPQPGHADALAWREAADALAQGRDAADDLVAGDHRQPRVGELAVDQVQIGAAHAAGLHPQQHLATAGARHRPALQAQRLAGAVEHHRAHGFGDGGGHGRAPLWSVCSVGAAFRG